MEKRHAARVSCGLGLGGLTLYWVGLANGLIAIFSLILLCLAALYHVYTYPNSSLSSLLDPSPYDEEGNYCGYH